MSQNTPRIWISSDTHFGHNRDFIYKSRGFSNIWEHDKAIIYNWNFSIAPEDEVYLLGDILLGDNNYGLSCLKQLKGNIHIIRGNHCTDNRWNLYNTCYNIVEMAEAKFLNYRNYHLFLSHYPCITSNADDDKPLKARVINMCGHSHTTDPYADMDKGLIYHVELDAHENAPILLDHAIDDVRRYIERK